MKQSSKAFLINLSIILIVIILWYAHPRPYILSDPGSYSHYAYKFSTGELFENPPTDVFAKRLGVIIPVALIYKLFGVNSITIYLFPLIITLLTLFGLWAIIKDPQIRLYASIIFILSVPQFQNTVCLLTDSIVSCFLLLSTVFLLKRNDVFSKKVSLYNSFLFMLFFFIAFMTKPSFYWILPLWIMVFIADLLKKRYQLMVKFYLPALFWGSLFFVVYLAFFKIIWGDPFSRFREFNGFAGYHLWSWNKKPVSDLISRISVDPIIFFSSEYLPSFALSIGGILLFGKKLKLWTAYYLFILLLFWFGSTSIHAYEPMPLYSRMILPLFPVMCIFAGYFVNTIFNDIKSLWDRPYYNLFLALSIPLIIISVPVFQKPINSISIISLIFFVSVMLSYYFRFNNKFSRRHLIFFIILISLPLMNYFRYVSKKELNDEKYCMDRFKDILNKNTAAETVLLCSDARSPSGLSFYWGYKYPDKLSVLFFGDYKNTDQDKPRIYFYINAERSRFLEQNYGASNHDSLMFSLSNSPPLYAKNEIYLLESNVEKYNNYFLNK